MGPKLPRMGHRKVESVLGRHGFVCIRQSGSHARWRHPDGRATTVPRHSKRILPPGTLKAIMDDTGLTADELR